MAWNAGGRNFWICLDHLPLSLQHEQMKGKRKWPHRNLLLLAGSVATGLTWLTSELAASVTRYWEAGGGRAIALQEKLRGKAFVWIDAAHSSQASATPPSRAANARHGFEAKPFSKEHSLSTKWALLNTLTYSSISIRTDSELVPDIAAALKAFPELEKFDISSSHDMPVQEIEKLYTWLGSLRRLRALSIDQKPPDIATFRMLQGKSSLESITITLAWFQPEYLEVLGTMPNLKLIICPDASHLDEGLDALMREKVSQFAPQATLRVLRSQFSCQQKTWPYRGPGWD